MYKFSVRLFIWASFFFCFNSCIGQQNENKSASHNQQTSNTKIGGACETCDIMYVGLPEEISATDTSAGWNENGQKLLVTGTVYKPDGRTPAAGIILYYWQTDTHGNYSDAKGLDIKAKKHGYIRGWVKTNNQGEYKIYTIRPSAYPDRKTPAHIHFLVKEPGLSDEYYIDDLVFDDDPLLIPYKKANPLENRGGSGIVRILINGEIQIGERDIVLGLNIPFYPFETDRKVPSGLPIGYDQPSFVPYHAYGPDKGSRACPVCKYGRYHGILFFVGNKPDWRAIKDWLLFLERESINRKQYLKAYFIYGNEQGYEREHRQKELEQLGENLRLKQMAICFVPSFTDKETEAYLNKINPEVENTFVVYKNRRIIYQQVNLKPSSENFQLISAILDSTRGNYFNLQGLPHD